MKIYVVLVDDDAKFVSSSKRKAYSVAWYMDRFSETEGKIEVRAFTDDWMKTQTEHGERIAARRKDNEYS